MRGASSMRRHYVLRRAPVAELGRTKINRQITAGLFARVLRDADVIELRRRSEPVGIHAA
jgi:hypothetical protein